MPPERRWHRKPIALAKAVALILLVAAVFALQSPMLVVSRGPLAFRLPRFAHRVICRILGIRVISVGPVLESPSTLWLANHLSYLDIPVLGSLLHVSFVSKDDVARWPVIGALARLQQTVFISRERGKVTRARGQVEDALASGRSLVLFPEGTSSDGRDVLPFHSSLLPDAQDRYVLQLLAIQLHEIDGRSGTAMHRDLYAYYGDMRLVTHLWAFLQGTGAVVRVIALQPSSQPGVSRKHVAERSRQRIFEALQAGAASIAGKHP